MAGSDGPDGTGKTPERASSTRDLELDRRRRQLGQALAARTQEKRGGGGGARSSDSSGYAAALRLSSEFVAGVLGGAAIGWVIDWATGISPWGLIVFLLLGFCAGVLNVLRSAGKVSVRGAARTGRDTDDEAGR